MKKLLDKIQSQLDAGHYVEAEDIQTLVGALRWRPIEEEPPIQTELWVTDGHRCVEAFSWYDGEIGSAYDSFDTLKGMKEITHWQPLPNPPSDD